MRRRFPWGLLLGIGAGFLLLRAARSARRKRGARRFRAAPAGEPQLVHEPGEVVRGPFPTPVEAGLEKPVATGFPETIPDRSTRVASPPHRSESVPGGRFEPVIPDAPELRDPSEEPRGGGEAPAAPIPPSIRKHR